MFTFFSSRLSKKKLSRNWQDRILFSLSPPHFYQLVFLHEHSFAYCLIVVVKKHSNNPNQLLWRPKTQSTFQKDSFPFFPGCRPKYYDHLKMFWKQKISNWNLLKLNLKFERWKVSTQANESFLFPLPKFSSSASTSPALDQVSLFRCFVFRVRVSCMVDLVSVNPFLSFVETWCFPSVLCCLCPSNPNENNHSLCFALKWIPFEWHKICRQNCQDVEHFQKVSKTKPHWEWRCQRTEWIIGQWLQADGCESAEKVCPRHSVQ